MTDGGAGSADGGTVLVEAVRRGDVRTVEKALGGGASPEGVDGDGVTLLGLAARNDDVEMVRALLEAGAQVNGRSRGGLTALMLAADAGAYRAAEELRGNRSYVALRDELGRSALDFAEAGAEREPDEPGCLIIVTDLEKYFGRRAGFAEVMRRALRFGDPDSDIWTMASWTLDSRADDETVEGAREALNSPRAPERYFAAQLLGFFCFLNASLRNQAHRMRQAAAVLRDRLPVEEDPAVLGVIIRGLVMQSESGFTDHAQGIMRHVGHPHPEVRAAVACVLEGSTEPQDRDLLQALITLARDPHAEVRRHAVASLAHLVDGPASVHTALRRALHDPDPAVVLHAALALGRLGRPLPFRAEQLVVRDYLDEHGEHRSYSRAAQVVERWPKEHFWDVRDSLPQ